MDLEPIWDIFIKQLLLHPSIAHVHWKKITGIPFLYITIIDHNLTQLELEKAINKGSAISIKGKRLHCETVFVRNDGMLYVYRHRFHVPQEKMFCCGNLCKDCIRLK